MMALLDIVLDASAILLGALLLLPLLRNRSAALRHWVLASAIACAALAAFAETVLPAWEPPFQLVVSELPRPLATIDRQVNEPRVSVATPQGGQPVSAIAVSGATASMVDRLIRIWSVGVVLMLGFLLTGLARLVVLTRRARLVTEGPWIDLIDRLRTACGIRGRVTVRETGQPGLLLIWGWRRPVLLVPGSARTWSEERILSVLRHELAHLRRHDWITQLMSEVVRALHWFNPLVWIACARLHVECERACDDAVLEAGVGGPQYATQLLDIARDLRHGGWWTPAPAIVRTSTLERRVKAMLDRTLDRRPLSRRARHTSVAILLALSVGVASVAATRQFASLTGTLVDPTNGVLPGVTVILINTETKARYEIRSDRTGRYEFVGLPPGSYVLETRLPGFATFRGAVTVTGQNVQQDLTLSVGMIEETISIVGGNVPVPDPEQQRILQERRVLEMQKVRELLERRAASKCPSAPATTSGAPIGGNIRVPVKLRDTRPRYPDRLNGVEGDAVLRATIGTDGSVQHVDVVSATHQEFADSLIEAVREWRFDVTLLNCVAIETAMKVTGTFRWSK